MDGLINLIENVQTFTQTLRDVLPNVDMQAMMARFTSPSFLVTQLINLILIYIVYIGYKGIILEYHNYRIMQKIQGRVKTKRTGENPLLRSALLRSLHDTLTFTLRQKGKLDKRDTIFYSVLGVISAASILLIAFNQYLLGVVIPFFLLNYTVKVLKSMEVDDLEYMHNQLPKGIDALLKAATKYGDTKNMFFEASRNLPYPIREEFETMARRMNSRDSEEVLMELKNKYDDIWINSFVFILISMLDDSGRELGMENLRKHRDMLNGENSLKMASVTEKRLSVNTNYALAGIAAVIGVGAILFTEVGREFYFSTPLGIICFVGGYSLVLAAIQINVKLSSTKDKR